MGIGKVVIGSVKAQESILGDEDDPVHAVLDDHKGLRVVSTQTIVRDHDGNFVTNVRRRTDERGMGGSRRAYLGSELADRDLFRPKLLDREVHRVRAGRGHTVAWKLWRRWVGDNWHGDCQKANQKGCNAQH